MPVLAKHDSSGGYASYILTLVMPFCFSSCTTDAWFGGKLFATLP
uniref:Uncharacterized protein n=1 Tax=Arundo donax TaxID=35708 RepID=A0A0A9BBI2_ARUDO